MSTLEFNGRMNVFTTDTQLSESHLQIGQLAKVTNTGKEYQIVDSANVSQAQGIRLANGNRAIPLSEVVREFSTMTDVKSCPNLHLGDKIRTWGSNTIGDSSGNDYVIISTSDAQYAPVEGDEYISAQFTARIVIRRVGQIEKIVSLTVPAGTSEVETKLTGMSQSPKIFVDGMLLTPGEHYEIIDHSKGIIKLLQTYSDSVNMIVIDSQLFSGANNNTFGGRYHSFTIPANQATVNCGLARLSAHPLLVVNGLHLTLGIHWNIADGSTGDITLVEPYEKDAEAIILDNYISGSIDASTIEGFTHKDFIKVEKTEQDVIENIKKSKYEIGDIILVTKPKAHYVIYEGEKGPGGVPIYPSVPGPDGIIPPQKGPYLNYYYSDTPYRVNNIKELQNSTIYKVGDVVEVYGNTSAGDGYHHLRIKVAEAGDDTIPASDGSGYWKLVPNSMISTKAESGGSTKTLKELEDSIKTGIDGAKVSIVAGDGLEGGGSSGEITLKIKTKSPVFTLDRDGLGINIASTPSEGGTDKVMSAEAGKQLGDQITQMGEALDQMQASKLNLVSGNGINIVNGEAGRSTISIKKQVGATGEALLLDGNGLGIRVVNDLSSGGANVPMSAEAGKQLFQKITTIKSGMTNRVIYQGVLGANATSITAPSELHEPALYLDGVRIDPQSFQVAGRTLTLNYNYSPKFSTVWIIEDFVPSTVPLNAMEAALLSVHENEATRAMETERMKNMLDNFQLYALNTFGIDLTKSSIDSSRSEGDLIRYIQDSGLKVAGKYYIDKNTDIIYRCIKSTDITENNPEFFERK